MKTAQDKLILGGHEFTSRFILGSGKFSLELVKACIEKADAQISTGWIPRAYAGIAFNASDVSMTFRNNATSASFGAMPSPERSLL